MVRSLVPLKTKNAPFKTKDETQALRFKLGQRLIK